MFLDMLWITMVPGDPTLCTDVSSFQRAGEADVSISLPLFGARRGMVLRDNNDP